MKIREAVIVRKDEIVTVDWVISSDGKTKRTVKRIKEKQNNKEVSHE